jgi:cytochrome c oxidase subunit 1
VPRIPTHDLNLVVHNTAWIPGHLHLTVGTAVTLTFMGITYWLVPWLCGRGLWSRRLALAQVWLWFAGMALFSNALHRLGVLGAPRRTMLNATPYLQAEWKPLLTLVGIGGTLLFVSALLYFLNLALTLVASARGRPTSRSSRRRWPERTTLRSSWIAGGPGSRWPRCSSWSRTGPRSCAWS